MSFPPVTSLHLSLRISLLISLRYSAEMSSYVALLDSAETPIAVFPNKNYATACFGTPDVTSTNPIFKLVPISVTEYWEYFYANIETCEETAVRLRNLNVKDNLMC